MLCSPKVLKWVSKSDHYAFEFGPTENDRLQYILHIHIRIIYNEISLRKFIKSCFLPINRNYQLHLSLWFDCDLFVSLAEAVFIDGEGYLFIIDRTIIWQAKIKPYTYIKTPLILIQHNLIIWTSCIWIVQLSGHNLKFPKH